MNCPVVIGDKSGEGMFIHDLKLAGEYVAPEFIPLNSIQPVKTGFNVNDGVLVFNEMKSFKKVMESLVNHKEITLDEWEDAVGFLSLRRYYNTMEEDENVDDYDLDNSRIEDKAMETVLNVNQEVQIGDSLYKIDYQNGKMYILNPVSKAEIDVWNINKSYCENSPKSTGAHRYFSSSSMVTGKKWNQSWGLYRSIGAKTTYYKKNWRGKWKKKKASTIYLLLDQWYHLKWRYSYEWPGTERDITNKMAWDQNVKSVSRTLQNDAGFSNFTYCVPEYGRIHHWTTNFNIDAHNTPW